MSGMGWPDVPPAVPRAVPPVAAIQLAQVTASSPDGGLRRGYVAVAPIQLAQVTASRLARELHGSCANPLGIRQEG